MSPFTEGLILFAIEIMFLSSFGIACFIVVAVLMNLVWCFGWVVDKICQILSK